MRVGLIVPLGQRVSRPRAVAAPVAPAPDASPADNDSAEAIRKAVATLQRCIDGAASRGLSVSIDVMTVDDVDLGVQRPVVSARIARDL